MQGIIVSGMILYILFMTKALIRYIKRCDDFEEWSFLVALLAAHSLVMFVPLFAFILYVYLG